MFGPREYGSVYAMEKLWRELGMDRIFSKLFYGWQFEFDVHASIQGMHINRAVDARKDVYYPHREERELHHLYSALDFLIFSQGCD
jgi:hypothetical protein